MTAVTPGPAAQWTFAADQASWQPRPETGRETEHPRVLRRLDRPAGDPTATAVAPYRVARTGDGAWEFSVVGEAPQLRSMVWFAALVPGDLSAARHFVLRYRALGLARSYAPRPVLGWVSTDAAGKETVQPLLDAAEVCNDDLWHVVIGRRPPPSGVTGLRVQVSTEDSAGRFVVGAIELWDAVPAPGLEPGLAPDLAGAVKHLQPLDLGSVCNDTVAAALERVLDKHELVTDGSATPAGLSAVAGVPFLCPATGSNLVRPEEHPEVNDLPAEFAGIKTTRRYFEPPGRDDTVVVSVGRKVSEVYLALCCELPKGGPRYATRPGPKPYADIGGLAVELRYAEGESEYAFPYSLADGGYALQRHLGVYAVAADPRRRLEQVLLHNRVFGLTFSLAGVTVNPRPRRLLPHLGRPPLPLRAVLPPTPPARDPYLRRDGDVLTLGNQWYEVVVDCRQGLALTQLTNRWAALTMALAPGSGLEVQVDELVLTGRAFSVAELKVSGTTAQVALVGTSPAVPPVRLELALSVDATPQLTLQARTANTGDQECRARVRFPVLRGLDLGDVEDTWLCFPRYSSVVSNRPGLFIAPNDRAFCLQFVDASNPGRGGGVALLTHNRDNAPLVYGLGKNRQGVTAYLEYPEEYYRLPPGQSRDLTESCLVFHPGDWHQALAAYDAWRRTWYRPVRAQDKDWFRQLFSMRVHLTARAYSWAIPIYDPETGQYRLDCFLAGDTDYMDGVKPQIVHLGGWCDFQRLVGGDFLGGDYAVKDYTGGAEALRATIAKVQNELGTPVSLYMIPDRCAKDSDIGKTLGDAAAVVREDGSKEQDKNTWYVCTEYQPWQDHYIAAAVRTQRELRVKALYVDVFGFSASHRCYSREHGHSVPSVPGQAAASFLDRLRAALPAETAIWSEFPVSDVSSQLLDGNITYYCLYWHEYFGSWHDGDGRAPAQAPFPRDLLRYALPDVRQFVFLCGSDDWTSDQKFPFFNGEPLYDVSWFLYAGPHLTDMRRALRLQTQYADCFSSRQPVPEVPTEMGGVCANAFPGTGRTVWTLYNANYATVHGPVLAVPHRPGAVYRDLWHDRVLQPTIRSGLAVIELTLHPQEVGCVLQE